MAFKKGNKHGKGRPIGSTNRRTAQEIADRLGIDPFEVLVNFAKGDWKALGYDSATVIKTYGENSNEEDRISAELRASSAKEACKYLHTQLKAVEHSGEIANPYMSKTPEELEELVKEKLGK